MLDASTLAVAIARRAGIGDRPLAVDERGARTVVLFPRHVAFVAHDDAGVTRLAVERRVLERLAGRLPVAIPVPVLADGRVCLRTKVIGTDGLEHHRRALADPVIGDAFAEDLGMLFAAVHTAFARDELQDLVAHGVPAIPQIDLEDVVRAAEALPERDIARAIVAAHRAQVVAPGDRTFLHGDLGSHNVVVDDRGRIAGLFDLEEAAVGDRHHELRWLPSYGERIVRRALDAYCGRTGATVDEARLRRAHVLAALEQYGWGLRAPQEHHRTGRTLEQSRGWAREVVVRVGRSV